MVMMSLTIAAADAENCADVDDRERARTRSCRCWLGCR